MEFGNNKNGQDIVDAVITAAGQYVKLPDQGKVFGYFGRLILVLIVLAAILGSFYTVGTEEKGVVLRLGKFSGITSAGLQFKLPFGIDKVLLVPTERVMKEEFGFRTGGFSGRSTYSKSGFSNESLILTGDLNVSDLEWIVQFKIEDPFKFVFNINNAVDTLRDVSEAMTRKIVGDANVTDVLTTDRAMLATKIQDEIQKTLNSYEIGIRIVTYKFQDVNPPESVKAAFNGVNEAEQQKESLILQAREQYNQQVPRARGEGKQMIQEAEGYALERINRAQGEASRFISVLDEYKKFPEVTRRRLYLETLEKVLPRMKDVIIVDDQAGKGSVLPLLPLQSFDTGVKGDTK
ncbi:MAG: FtsH protease activity modulator HflK [Candidatus Riflebacteria bacterium]|jgi:membrane protease subunit HflK|nr:FtsH protease activity modulator HflK [Candidatus Riflebacteria bacterium]